MVHRGVSTRRNSAARVSIIGLLFLTMLTPCITVEDPSRPSRPGWPGWWIVEPFAANTNLLTRVQGSDFIAKAQIVASESPLPGGVYGTRRVYVANSTDIIKGLGRQQFLIVCPHNDSSFLDERLAASEGKYLLFLREIPSVNSDLAQIMTTTWPMREYHIKPSDVLFQVQDYLREYDGTRSTYSALSLAEEQGGTFLEDQMKEKYGIAPVTTYLAGIRQLVEFDLATPDRSQAVIAGLASEARMLRDTGDAEGTLFSIMRRRSQVVTGTAVFLGVVRTKTGDRDLLAVRAEQVDKGARRLVFPVLIERQPGPPGPVASPWTGWCMFYLNSLWPFRDAPTLAEQATALMRKAGSESESPSLRADLSGAPAIGAEDFYQVEPWLPGMGLSSGILVLDGSRRTDLQDWLESRYGVAEPEYYARALAMLASYDTVPPGRRSLVRQGFGTLANILDDVDKELRRRAQEAQAEQARAAEAVRRAEARREEEEAAQHPEPEGPAILRISSDPKAGRDAPPPKVEEKTALP